MKERAIIVIRRALVLLAAGLLYYFFVTATGWYIPCVFRLLTGKLCPGCGVSHLFTHLFRGNVRGAFSANPFVFCLLPPAFVYTGWRTVRFVRRGPSGYSAWEERMFICAACAAVVFGILRNIF